MCKMREKLGFTIRDVHQLSKQIAKSLRNPDYIVSPSQLCDIERKGRHTKPVSLAHSIARLRLKGGTVADFLRNC